VSFDQIDIGRIYDLGIATRDGTNLSCKDRDGNAQLVSQMAFMTSPTEQQNEATELQNKQKLTQLASPNLIDREFDQWPQVTQGDWTGGMGQRVLGSNLSTLGIPVGDALRYWEGYGIVWPVDDYIPQQPVVVTRTFNSTTAPTDISGGFLADYAGGNAQLLSGYAFIRVNSADNHWHIMFVPQSGVSVVDQDLGAAGQLTFLTVDHGAIWGVDELNNLVAYTWNPIAVTLTKNIIAASHPASGLNSFIRLGAAGNQIYAAVASQIGLVDAPGNIRLFNLTKTTGGGWATAAFVDLAFTGNYMVTDIAFLGDDMMVGLATTDSSNAAAGHGYLIAYNLPSQQWRTVAKFPYQGLVYFCTVAGGLFVVAMFSTNQFSTFASSTLELYLVQGTSVQDLGPLTIRDGSSTYSLCNVFETPMTFGPYALFEVTVNHITILYAFDVLRGRFFKAARYDEGALPDVIGMGYRRFSPVGVGNLLTGTGFTSQMMVVHSGMHIASNVLTMVEWHLAVNKAQLPGFGPIVVGPVDIISSMIDFTSASPKLYRQVVAQFSALANSASASITINAWLDQDVGTLSAVPDFTTGAIAGNNSPGITKLALPINKIGKKIVYQVVTTGGVFTSGAWVDAPKISTVAIQAATGWVWHLFLDLTRNAKTNTGAPEDYCYQRQGGNIDESVAYNFLRQLWRQKGGECVLTLPNGDQYNALVQQESFNSPKPFGSSFVSDQGPRYENIVEIVAREDI
jgi:hypothetical protein